MTSTNDILKRMNEHWIFLDQAGYDTEQLDEEEVIARIEWKKAYARTFLSESGSMELRKQQATLDCIDLELDMEIAGVKLRAGRDKVRKLGLQLEILRSMNAAAQRQFMTEPIGQYT